MSRRSGAFWMALVIVALVGANVGWAIDWDALKNPIGSGKPKERLGGKTPSPSIKPPAPPAIGPLPSQLSAALARLLGGQAGPTVPRPVAPPLAQPNPRPMLVPRPPMTVPSPPMIVPRPMPAPTRPAIPVKWEGNWKEHWGTPGETDVSTHDRYVISRGPGGALQVTALDNSGGVSDIRMTDGTLYFTVKTSFNVEYSLKLDPDGWIRGTAKTPTKTFPVKWERVADEADKPPKLVPPLGEPLPAPPDEIQPPPAPPLVP